MMNRRIAGRLLAACIGLWFAQTVPAVEEVFAPEGPGQWLPLKADGLHDPAGPGIHQLQNPAEALFYLPAAFSGNKVRWAEAVQEGYIEPLPSILDNDYQMQVLDLDVLRTRTAGISMVLFPHKQHTEWLECGNCHEWLFKSKAGATRFGMFDVLNGEYCGRCHGAVAFPLTDCYTCHSVKRSSLKKPFKELELHK